MEISSPRLQAEWHGRKGQSTGKSISLSSWSQLGIARSCESILAIGTRDRSGQRVCCECLHCDLFYLRTRAKLDVQRSILSHKS